MNGRLKRDTGNSVEDVGCRLALREAEEEATEALTGLLDGKHAVMDLEVAKVLLADAALLAGAQDARAGEGAADLAESGAGALIGGRVEVDAPLPALVLIGEDASDGPAGIARLLEALGGEGDLVVRGGGVGGGVEVALAFAMAHQYDPSREVAPLLLLLLIVLLNAAHGDMYIC